MSSESGMLSVNDLQLGHLMQILPLAINATRHCNAVSLNSQNPQSQRIPVTLLLVQVSFTYLVAFLLGFCHSTAPMVRLPPAGSPAFLNAPLVGLKP